MVIAIAFVALSLLACIKRSMNREVPAANAAPTSNTTTTQPAADQTAPSRRRRRPRRTPSQISTKSLPPYMKEPGDHELVVYRSGSYFMVLFYVQLNAGKFGGGRGQPEMEDEPPPNGMPTLGEVEENIDPSETHFNIPLNHVATRETLPDASAVNLSRNLIRHTTGVSIDGHSVDSSLQSHGSNVELLVSHSRTLSNEGSPDSMGEAPPYSEVVGGDVSTFTFPQPAVPAPAPPQIQNTPRSRFSFLIHPFVSRTASLRRNNSTRAAPSTHTRSTSAFSFHSSEHSARPETPTSSRHLLGLRGHRSRTSSSGSAALLTSPSMISLNSISAPLQHTLTRTEFRIPRGGLTPEQIKIISARDAAERFGRPYGPAAVAFAGSRVLLTSDTTPPPGFEEVFGEGEAQAEGAPGEDTPAEDADTADDGAVDVEVLGPVVETGVSSPSDTPSESISRQHAPTSDEHEDPAELRVDVRASIAKSFVIADPDEPATPHTARPLDFVSAAAVTPA